MRRLAAALLTLIHVTPAVSQPAPGLSITVNGGPTLAVANPLGCDVHESPDAPARAVHLADGTVQLYATDQVNQLTAGPDLLHLVQNCAVVYEGRHDDDPAAFDDRSWLTTPWTADGQTIWAIVHDEFHGNLRKSLCPTGRYMDCWYNALTLAVSLDAGQHFRRIEPPATVASLPYRYEGVGIGHHGYFNPTNIVSWGGQLYMLVFATKTGVQAEGNCLLRTGQITDPKSWRAWNDDGFTVRLIDPYRESGDPIDHVCRPVAPTSLRWPVASLVRHSASGLFLAIMQDARRDGAIYFATSPDLLRWSAPARLMSAVGAGSWLCGDPAPLAYPAVLDPASADRNFETLGDHPVLFLTQFEVQGCRRGPHRTLVRWNLDISDETAQK